LTDKSNVKNLRTDTGAFVVSEQDGSSHYLVDISKLPDQFPPNFTFQKLHESELPTDEQTRDEYLKMEQLAEQILAQKDVIQRQMLKMYDKVLQTGITDTSQALDNLAHSDDFEIMKACFSQFSVDYAKPQIVSEEEFINTQGQPILHGTQDGIDQSIKWFQQGGFHYSRGSTSHGAGMYFTPDGHDTILSWNFSNTGYRGQDTYKPDGAITEMMIAKVPPTAKVIDGKKIGHLTGLVMPATHSYDNNNPLPISSDVDDMTKLQIISTLLQEGRSSSNQSPMKSAIALLFGYDHMASHSGNPGHPTGKFTTYTIINRNATIQPPYPVATKFLEMRDGMPQMIQPQDIERDID